MMFTLMFDPCFKSMNCIMDHVGRDQATVLVQQYDDLVMLAFLNNNVGFLCQVKLQHFQFLHRLNHLQMGCLG